MLKCVFFTPALFIISFSVFIDVVIVDLFYLKPESSGWKLIGVFIVYGFSFLALWAYYKVASTSPGYVSLQSTYTPNHHLSFPPQEDTPAESSDSIKANLISDTSIDKRLELLKYGTFCQDCRLPKPP